IQVAQKKVKIAFDNADSSSRVESIPLKIKYANKTIVATSTTEAEYVAAASGCGQVLWIQNQMLDYGIETTNQETKIIATVDGKPRTISESSLRRHLKINDEEGISSLPDDSPPLSHQTIIPEPIPHDLQALTKNLTPRRLTKREIRIAQSKALSPGADEPASLSSDDRHREAFHTVSSLDAGQDRENIAKTSAMSYKSSPRVPSLDADAGKDKESRRKEPIQEDALITREIIDIKEELGAEKSTEKGSNDNEEMVNLLNSTEAANILSSGGAAFPTAGVPTVSESFPNVSAIFTTASVVAREMEEEFARENQRLSKQAARDSKIARIHAEEELKLMIESLDRSNEVIAKHLSEYEQAEADLSIGEKIELISELVKYQDHLAEILNGMTLEQIKEKFIPVWKHMQDFVPMSSNEESEKVKRSGIKLDQGSSKRQFDREDLHQLWILFKETFSIKQCTRDKEKELWVELKRLFEPDSEDQLWTYHQAFMHDPLDWKLYDTCGVHHVSTKNQEIFMLVEKDYSDQAIKGSSLSYDNWFGSF
nr:putative ribonuclease H-like domain-containing protein [Tanacetum cinerariifolium]